jgi:hypothetical protein
MIALGFGIAYMGYWVMYYGVTQVQGGNWGFLDLGVPSRWAKAAGTPKDGGANPNGSVATSGGVAQQSPGAGDTNPSNKGGTQPTVIQPTGNGSTGVDFNGNLYTKVNGAWVQDPPPAWKTGGFTSGGGPAGTTGSA